MERLVMETGTVKWFNDAKGFGFIIADKDKANLIAHQWRVLADPQTLFEFQRVEFDRNITIDNIEFAENIKVIETRNFDMYDYDFETLDGEFLNLSKYIGQVVLVVNTASECGLTGQYAKLQELHEKYKDRGLAVLGFPSNNFGKQEPGTDEQIAEFVKQNYGVTFTMFKKSHVSPLDKVNPEEVVTGSNNEVNGFYDTLISKTGKLPFWNFHKYLISKDGTQVLSFNSMTDPDELVEEIEKLLDA